MPNILPITSNIQKKYRLVSKEAILDLKTAQNLPERIGFGDAAKADVVIVEKISNPDEKTIITTFRDAFNNIMERVHEYTAHNKPDTHRIYSELENYGNESIKGRLVQTKENLDITGKYQVWKKIASEKQYVKYNAQNEPTNLTIAKVTTKERFLNPSKTEEHSLTEYYVPKAHNGEKKATKYIKFSTDKGQTEIPEIVKIETSEGVKIPENDEFLSMRIYDADDIKIPITRTALRDNGLNDLKISIEEDFAMGKKTQGNFNQNTGRISFNYRPFSKKSIVDTGYHESKHAYQYAIEALGGYGNTSYAGRCRRDLKIPMTPELRLKATDYHVASLQYVPASKDYEAYRKNLLEKEAWEVGENAQKYYQQKAEELSSQFKGIPIEEL